MTEQSLFNVACKISGLWMLLQGVSLVVWAFLSSRLDAAYVQYGGGESANWISGAIYTTMGLFFCSRSSWLTRLVFALDAELDSDASRTNQDD